MHATSEFLHPYDVGLILTYKCQCACKHCMFNCGPAWEEWMTLENIQEALQMILALGSVRQIHFTGGEPFLNFPLLLAGVQAAKETGLPQYLETNAGWCVSVDQVDEQFALLKEAGLTVISISCSPFHAETIPLTRTLLAIDRALAIFGSHRVMVDNVEMINQIQRFGTRTPTPLYRYIEAYGNEPAGLLFWKGNELKSSGRAGYTLGDLASRYEPEEFRRMDCLEELLTSEQASFDPYGNYIPSACGGLALGSWHHIEEIAYDDWLTANLPSQHNLILKTLIHNGPYGLYNVAIRDYDYMKLNTGYVDKCHLCVDVRRHLANQEHWDSLAPVGFYHYF